MNYDKESKKIINMQKKCYPQIEKKQNEILMDGNLYSNTKNVEYIINKGENICQTEMKY